MQNFSKSLLDVADNLGRASSVVKESFSKLDTSEDSSGAVPLLKTLLEGVDMTDKQLGEVLLLCSACYSSEYDSVPAYCSFSVPVFCPTFHECFLTISSPFAHCFLGDNIA